VKRINPCRQKKQRENNKCSEVTINQQQSILAEETAARQWCSEAINGR